MGKIDGICGIKTINAIIDFQKGFLHYPDGLIQVNGISWKKLTSSTPNEMITLPQVVFKTWSGDSSKWSQEKKLMSLNAIFRPKVQTVLKNLRSKGYQLKIFYGWRSVQVQRQLKKAGRSKVDFSFHNAQLQDGRPNSYAVDIIDSRWAWSKKADENNFWEALGAEAKAAGLVCGGGLERF